MKYIAYCHACMDHIKLAWGSAAVDVYRMVCKSFAMTDNPIVISQSMDNVPLIDMIGTLEQRGFLVSHETDSDVLVKPVCTIETSDEESKTVYYFCPTYGKEEASE